jgi:hypothetical protein
MRQQTYTVMSYREAETLVKEYLGLNDPYYNLIADLVEHDIRWANGTVHSVTVAPESDWLQPNHTQHLAEVQAKRKVEWGWELEAVLNELSKAGKLQPGEYLIEVSW